MRKKEFKGPSQQPVNKHDCLAGKVITSEELTELKRNVHGRYYSGASKVSLPVIVDEDGRQHCRQFSLEENDSVFRPVHNLSWDDDHQIIRGETPGGTKMTGVVDRALSIDYSNHVESYHGTIIPMSPERGQRKKNHFSFIDNEDGLSLICKINQTHVNKQDVYARANGTKKRKPSQKGVMKRSAGDELKRYLNENSENIAQEVQQYLKSAKDMEWLHIIAYSLTQLRDNPQVRSNLGAARKVDNTRMMVIEKIPKKFSQYHDVSVDIVGKFQMLPHSELVKDIAYTVELHHGSVCLKVYQNIDVFSEYEHPRNTDQLIALVIEGLLQGRAQKISAMGMEKRALENNDAEMRTAAVNDSSVNNNSYFFRPRRTRSQSGSNSNNMFSHL